MRNTSRSKALAQAKELAKQEAERQKQTKITIFSAIGLTVVGLVLLLSYILSQSEDSTTVTESQQSPITVTENAFKVEVEGIKKDAKRVDVFFDPMCPGCAIVDQAIGEELAKLVDNGDISLYLSPVSFLDEASSDDYSTRAINAFVAIAEYDSRLALKFMNVILSEDFQPNQGGTYSPVPNSKFVEIAKSINIPDNVTEKILNMNYMEWITETSRKQTERTDLFPEGFSTPAVFVNVTYDGDTATGERVEFTQHESILETFVNTLNK